MKLGFLRGFCSLALLLVVFSALRTTPASAATFSADSVKAAFLYRFAAYVEWPAALSDQGPFLIGVIGDDAVADQLQRLLPGMSVDGHPVQLRRVTQTRDLEGLRILYIGPRSLARSRAVRDAAAQLPILLVTGDPRGFEGDAVINFIEVNRNVRFEISLNAADRRRLRIDSALLAVAVRVDPRKTQ